MNDGVFAGLADDQISPLNNNNADEERSVARVLQDLPLTERLRQTHRQKGLASGKPGDASQSLLQGKGIDN